MELKDKKCVPCEGGVEPFKEKEIREFKDKVDSDWDVIDNKKIKRKFPFKNFKESMAFVNKIADIAEEEQHHPDITIHYDEVEVELTTHAIKGLSENDFIIASKIDDLK
ncbi:MAG: 4a-hydroxytetrahydrobiopterin dehydratase [Bacteroidales bacterium]|jgi:4a-hydroxytetrahydrobiopterin dehydratase|nr:4a-hydroxytetrahydrobiopterin dehydratase [Bacteroidales bacterium]